MTAERGGAIRFCPRCGRGGLEWRVPRRDDKERQVCLGCGYVHYVGPALAAGAIVRHEGRICLVRRAHDPGFGRWTFPGGFVDPDEEASAAARREVEEETGCLVRLGDLVGVYNSTGPAGKRVVIVVYAATLLRDGTPRSAEVGEMRWFAPEELPWGEFAFPSTEEALRTFLASGGGS